MAPECLSFLKARLQFSQTQLEFYEKEYGENVRKVRLEYVSEDSHVPVISIAGLSKVASAEAKALDDVTTHQLSLVQLTSTRAGLEQELQGIRQAKELARTGPTKSKDATEDDSKIQDLESIIEEYADKIREHKSWIVPLSQKAWVAMEAANLAAKCDIELPGIGKWSHIPAPTTITAAPISVPTTVTAPPISTPTTAATAPTLAASALIIVKTAQVKIPNVVLDDKATAKDSQASAASDIVATLPRSTTAIVKVDSTLSSITLCTPQKQYANVKSVEQKKFVVGDIGWFPVLRLSLCESPSDIHTEFGYICAKSYPLIIVERLQDCMLGLIISTSNGNGLRWKSTSIKSRSALLVTESSRNLPSAD